MFKIALYIYWDNHAQFREKLYPIAKAANKKNGAKAVIVTQNWKTFPDDLKCIPYIKLHQFDEHETPSSILHQDGFLKKVLAYIQKFYKDKIFWKKQAKKIIDNYQPDVIFFWASYNREVPWLLKYAKNNGIKSFLIGEYSITFGIENLKRLHRRNTYSVAKKLASENTRLVGILLFSGVYLQQYIESLSYKLLGLWSYKRCYITVPAATHHLVSNENYREELLRQGVDEKKVITTGIPEHDELISLRIGLAKSEEKRGEKMLFGIKETDKVIIFMLENFPALNAEISSEEVISMIKKVINVCLLFKNTTIIIKAHPRDLIDNYIWIKEEYPSVHLYHQEDTIRLVAISDVVIVHGTTAVSMAIALERPAIIFNFKKHYICDAIHQAFGVPQVLNEESLRLHLEEIFHGNFSYDSDIFERAFRIIDGRAIERILAISELNKNISVDTFENNQTNRIPNNA